VTVNRNSALAWAFALAPIVLVIPAFLLAGMGPYAFTHPFVLVVAFLLFIGLEVTALFRFVKVARSGAAALAMVGMGLALVMLVLNAALEYYVAAEYLEDVRLGLM